MDKIEIEKIRIGEKCIDRITDEEGVRWYPLKTFIMAILCKSDKVSSFRDSAMIRYMKVIEYISDKQGAKRPIKTWCISENGIKYLLRHMTINNKGNSNKRMYKAREKGFYEACTYFGVKTPDKINPKYINTPPQLKNYDIWSILCIENDIKLCNSDKWKKCDKCNYFYPDKIRYFGDKKKQDSVCLQCQGKNFKCRNKIIQYIYDNDGLDLLYKLHLDNDKEGIVTELNNFIDKGGVKK